MFTECFGPTVNLASGSDLIFANVYEKKVQTQDFGKFYCALLVLNTIVIAAAMLQIFYGAQVGIVAEHLGFGLVEVLLFRLHSAFSCSCFTRNLIGLSVVGHQYFIASLILALYLNLRCWPKLSHVVDTLVRGFTYSPPKLRSFSKS